MFENSTDHVTWDANWSQRRRTYHEENNSLELMNNDGSAEESYRDLSMKSLMSNKSIESPSASVMHISSYISITSIVLSFHSIHSIGYRSP